MKPRMIVLTLALLNVGLLGAVAYLVSTRPVPVPLAQPNSETPQEPPRRIADRRAVATPLASAPGQSFNWREVESSDFRKYIANLRAIGCPEETIRDIIITDVNKLYAAKLAAVAGRAKDFKFWQSGNAKTKLAGDARKQLRDLQNEKRELIKDLLGVDLDQELRKSGNYDVVTDEMMFGSVPESKRSQVREIVERYAEMEKELRPEGQRGFMPGDQAELKKIRDQRQAELAKVLTQDELENYELRNSSTADFLRNRLGSLNVSEDEFRKLFRLQKDFEQSAGGCSPGDFAAMQQREQARRQMEDQIQGVLGDARFDEYKLNQDLAYRGLAQVVRQNNLPQETVSKVFDMKRAVEDQVRQLTSDQTIDRDERSAMLKNISAETEKAMIESLGEKAFQEYKRIAGFWMEGISQGAISSMILADQGGVRMMRTIDDGPPRAGADGTIRRGAVVRPPNVP